MAWGDGAVDPLAIESFEMGAQHAFAEPGTRLVAVSVVDDDTGAGTATRQLEVVDAAGAVAAVVARLRLKVDDPTTPPQIRTSLRLVLAQLEGQKGGGAANGAFELLARSAWQAALVKMRMAVVLLDAAGFEYESMVLVMAARSLLIELIEGATRQPAAAAEAEAIIRSIDAMLPRPEQIDECQRALVALRPALG